MKLVAFTDYVYRRVDGVVYAERAFALFLTALGERFDELTIVGRLDPGPGPLHYPLPTRVKFVGLPHYSSLTRPLSVGSSLVRSLAIFWRELDDADRVWLLGPYPHAVAFALLSLLRRRSLVLGVRQDFPQYVRSRRPDAPLDAPGGRCSELPGRPLARRAPVVVVGPELARHYGHAPAVLEMAVSLISDARCRGRQSARRSAPTTASCACSASAGSTARRTRCCWPTFSPACATPTRAGGWWCAARVRWREALQERLRELGLDAAAELRGYVAIDGGLLELYRSSHVFLHVSLTEGMPQVLLEAFASGGSRGRHCGWGRGRGRGRRGAADRARRRLGGGAARGADRGRPRAARGS